MKIISNILELKEVSNTYPRIINRISLSSRTYEHFLELRPGVYISINNEAQLESLLLKFQIEKMIENISKKYCQ